jgi:hypothetical protein
MTVKKIRVSNEKETNKEKEKLKISRERLLEIAKKKTFKSRILPNISSIKNEVVQFKKERNDWKSLEKEKEIKISPKIILKSKLTKIKRETTGKRGLTKKQKTNNVIPYRKIKRKNTKKLNEIEILVLVEHLSDLLMRNRIDKISNILNKIKRNQYVQILNYYNIFKKDTNAPTPLLRNVLFNILFNDIYIN